MVDKIKPTIENIAKKAGVSPSTASMILAGKDGFQFSESTVKKVVDVASELGYHKRKKANKEAEKIIAVVCPNVSNPYYSKIVQSIEQSAYKADYDVAIFNTYREPKLERRIISIINKINASGVIFAMAPSDPLAIEKLNIPIVALCDKNESLRVDTIETDNYSAGCSLGECLKGLGHKKIAYISTTLGENHPQRVLRLDGLKSVFSSQDDEVLVFSREITPKEERKNLSVEYDLGYSLCLEALQSTNDITAFVGINDEVSYGILDALKSKGKKVPQDVSVAGFDNNFTSSLSSISLTSIEPYMNLRGENAVKLILSKINNVDSEDALIKTRLQCGHKLVERDSTARAKS